MHMQRYYRWTIFILFLLIFYYWYTKNITFEIFLYCFSCVNIFFFSKLFSESQVDGSHGITSQSIREKGRKNDIDHNNNFERFRWLYMLFLSLLGVVGFTFVVFFIFSILTLHLPRMPGTFRVDNFISHYLIILYFGFCKLYNLPQS